VNFTLRSGRPFSESFDFKNAQGKPISLPAGRFKLVLERGQYAREFTEGAGLTRQRTSLLWKVSDKENFEFSTMYYTLYLNDKEVTRGVLSVE
jgi:hypothetical protein